VQHLEGCCLDVARIGLLPGSCLERVVAGAPSLFAGVASGLVRGVLTRGGGAAAARAGADMNLAPLAAPARCWVGAGSEGDALASGGRIESRMSFFLLGTRNSCTVHNHGTLAHWHAGHSQGLLMLQSRVAFCCQGTPRANGGT
jgi:hypothetical protein